MTGHVTGGLVTEAASLLVKPRPLGLCVTRGAQAGGLVIGAVVGPSLAPAGGGNVHVVQEPVSLRVPVSRGPGGRRGKGVDQSCRGRWRNTGRGRGRPPA